MKRIILAGLSMIFSIGLFAQKALIIHKTDGTKLEIPMQAINGFWFNGKAIVNDDDYTKITNVVLHSGKQLDITFTAEFHTDDPFISKEKPYYGENWGILYATTPNVTIETGELLQPIKGQSLTIENFERGTIDVQFGEFNSSLDNLFFSVDLEFETTYYFRTFVRRPSNSDIYEEEYFYSKEQSVYTDKPTMLYYGATIDPAPYAQTGYVMPSDSAWISLAERYPYIAVRGTCADLIKEHWNEYLTPERIAALKPQCATTYECSDGRLYILNSIGDDFAQYAINLYDDEFTTSGYTEDYSQITTDTLIECEASWNVPNNRYWEYKSIRVTGNPDPTIKLSKPLMANYNYTIEIMFAPDITQTDTLPSKFNLTFEYTSENGKLKRMILGKDLQTNDQLGTVFTFDSLSVGGFGEASLAIKGHVTSRETQYSRILRIAQIKVTPLGIKEEGEE